VPSSPKCNAGTTALPSSSATPPRPNPCVGCGVAARLRAPAGTPSATVSPPLRLKQAQQRMDALQTRNRGKRSSKRKAVEKVVVSVSDPEAVVGRDKENGYRPLYNVPVVDDLDSPLLLGYGVFAPPNDAGLLATMLVRLKEGQVKAAADAAGGYGLRGRCRPGGSGTGRRDGVGADASGRDQDSEAVTEKPLALARGGGDVHVSGGPPPGVRGFESSEAFGDGDGAAFQLPLPADALPGSSRITTTMPAPARP
jgi:hypothetical protein